MYDNEVGLRLSEYGKFLSIKHHLSVVSADLWSIQLNHVLIQSDSLYIHIL